MSHVFSDFFQRLAHDSKYRIHVAFWVACALVFAFSLRGISGNLSEAKLALEPKKWGINGPLELSPERGRFMLLFSIVENKSLAFTLPLARFATPDLAITPTGQYVSLFAPGVSFLVIPGYIVGKALGISQVGAYAVIAMFAFANMYLLYKLSRRLGADTVSAKIASVSFGFASPAFAYGVNLYQHHVSTFLLLMSAMLLLDKKRTLASYAFVWFACAISVVIDNPNFFLMAPVGVYGLILFVKDTHKILQACLTPKERPYLLTRRLFTFVSMAFPVIFFFWYNFAAYGDPLQLPGTLNAVESIGADGSPIVSQSDEEREKDNAVSLTGSSEKTAVSFFDTRNMYDGFYTHFLSSDRGIINYTPVMLLGFVGLALFYKRNPTVASFFILLVGVNILTYSMWGDPWGGWAFGSRYLIPSYAILALGIALLLSTSTKKHIIYVCFIPLLGYSLWVNTLGAITTSSNPPQVQVLRLEAKTGHEQKYTFMRNWEFLQQKYEKVGSKAFIYQAYMKNALSAPVYFRFVLSLVILTVGLAFMGDLHVKGRNT